jgi:hypothetical protein
MDRVADEKTGRRVKIEKTSPPKAAAWPGMNAKVGRIATI